MAEIPVERKSSMTWLWLLLAVLVVGLLLWWLLDDDDPEVAGAGTATTVEAGAEPDGAFAQPGGTAAAGAGAGAGAFAGGGAGDSVAQILANPAGHVGRDDFAADVAVPDVPTDRGFWVEQDGARLFGVLMDAPSEAIIDIDPDQQIRVTEGRLLDSSGIGEIPGPIEAETRRTLEEQEIFLLVDEADVELLSSAAP